MKGVVLAGGLGTRLRPLTQVTNKHLLPVYDRPMIFYPLEMLAEAGMEEVMIVVGGQSTEEIMKLCKDGSQWGLKSLYYVYQEGETGIAKALALTESFVKSDDVCVVLGDNIMLGDSLKRYCESFKKEMRGAMVLAAEVPDPQNYGVPTIEKSTNRILYITEKPAVPESKFGIIGVYLYDGTLLFDQIKHCKPSARGELEITDVNNLYAAEKDLAWMQVKGMWIDAGSSINAWVAAGRMVEQYKSKEEEFPELIRKG